MSSKAINDLILIGSLASTAKKTKAKSDTDQKLNKLLWQEILYETSLKKGYLCASWKPLYQIDPSVYSYYSRFGTKLVSLKLIGVQLQSFPTEIGELLQDIEVISLENNNLMSIPDNIVNCTQLRSLNLSYNQISILPQRIGYLCSLTEITLNNNKLETLPITFGALNMITRVDLECNILKVLPENLDNMTCCEVFNVNKNKLIRLPRCLGRMPSLTLLSANWNSLQYLPQELFKSDSITGLRLSTNSLVSLPESIGELTQLKELALDYNKLRRLPLSFYRLTNLKILRIEGNDELIDPPPEIMNGGASTVIQYCQKSYQHDRDGRMRHIIYAMQNVLAQIVDKNLSDPSLFEPDVELADFKGDQWYAMQLSHLWNDLMPRIQLVWNNYRLQNRIETTDILTEFSFSEKEVMWAFSNYSDAMGPVLHRRKIMFRKCSCINPASGERIPCVPPRVGYMCFRECYLFKKHLVRQKDRQERLWVAYKENGLTDAVRRAEAEAKEYLKSQAGDRWLKETAYEQAEELLLEGGADGVVESRIKNLEKRKKNMIAKFDKRIKRVQRRLNKKTSILQPELNRLKENRKLAREGYMRNIVEKKIDDLAYELANLPEIVELEVLHMQCEHECKKIEHDLYEESSSDDENYTSDEYDSDDSSEEAQKWRRKRDRRRKKKEQEDKVAEFRKKTEKPGSETPLQKYVKSATQVMDSFVMKPIVKPLSKVAHKLSKKAHRSLRDVVEVARIRVRRSMLKVQGNYDEVMQELLYEISKQYIDHNVSLAKEKVRREFFVIEKVRQSVHGTSVEYAFISWKKWVWTKQSRLRRDLRHAFKMATKGYNSAMESIRSAQVQVEMWLPQQDIYTDRPYWQHFRTGAITFEQPTIEHFLPPNFTLPVRPKNLPTNITLESSSSSEDDVMAWQRKFGKNRQMEEQRRKEKDRQRNLQVLDRDVEGEYGDEDDDASLGEGASSTEGGEYRDPTGSLYGRRRRSTMYNNDDTQRYASNGYAMPQPSPSLSPSPLTALLAGGATAMSVASEQTEDSSGLKLTRKAKAKNAVATELDETLKNVNLSLPEFTLPALAMAHNPTALGTVSQHIAPKVLDEWEAAYKVIRKVRNQLNPARQSTYLNQRDRKPKSFEQIRGQQKQETHMVEIEEGVFVDENTVDLANPSDEYLLSLAGGTLDMIQTGKAGIELRTVLATRALHLKRKMLRKAREKKLIPMEKNTFYKKEIKPIFMHKYEGSSSEDEEEKERAHKEAKELRKEQRRQARLDDKRMEEKLKEEQEKAKSIIVKDS